MANKTNQFGLWQPWQPKEVGNFFSTLTAPWWIAGGWALDLFLGEQTRDHEDIDVQILRHDQQDIRTFFGAWDVQGADPGELPAQWPFREWQLGGFLSPRVHDVWCRPHKTSPWTLQLMIADTTDDQWLFRRDARIRRSLTTVGTERTMVSRISLQKFSSCTRPKRHAPKTKRTLLECSRFLMGRVASGWLSPLLLSILDIFGYLNSLKTVS